jgi:hypothetical protein
MCWPLVVPLKTLIIVFNNRAKFMMAYIKCFSLIVSIFLQFWRLKYWNFFTEIYMHVGKCAHLFFSNFYSDFLFIFIIIHWFTCAYIVWGISPPCPPPPPSNVHILSLTIVGLLFLHACALWNHHPDENLEHFQHPFNTIVLQLHYFLLPPTRELYGVTFEYSPNLGLHAVGFWAFGCHHLVSMLYC